MNLLSRFLILATLLSCGLTTRVSAQAPAPASAADATAPETPPHIDPAKEVEIRKMLQLNGTAKLMEQMKTRMLAAFRERGGNVPSEVWDRMDKDMDTRVLLEKLIPLYDKYYTLDDLKAANTFYESPAGQHILGAMPQLLADSSRISQAWGREVGMKVMLEMQDAKQKMPATPPPSAPSSTPAPVGGG